ncbi:hypothetical protein D9M72_414430 [compost metagenome]
MRIGQERLGPIRCPFDRHAGTLRSPETDDLLRIDIDLRAEATADIGRDHPELVFRSDIIKRAHHQPRHMRVLAGGVAGIVVVADVIDAKCGPRLHRIGREPVVMNRDLGDMRSR